MSKIIISVILILLGLFILLIWYAGSHGNISFTSGRIDDWVFAGPVLLCFAVPLFLLLRGVSRWLRKRG